MDGAKVPWEFRAGRLSLPNEVGWFVFLPTFFGIGVEMAYLRTVFSPDSLEGRFFATVFPSKHFPTWGAIASLSDLERGGALEFPCFFAFHQEPMSKFS